MIKGNESGRSMIEMLGVLAIIGVLSVGGIAGYSKAMMKYRINKTIEQISLIAGNVRSFFGQQKDYTGARCGSDGTYNLNSYTDCAVAKKAKLFPDEMLTIEGGAITNIENAFGGKMGIEAISSTDGSRTFTINMNQLPVEACIELASHDWSTANAVSVVVVEYSNNTFHYTSSTLPLDMPADIGSVTTKCSAVSGSYNIGLFITFK